MAHGAEVVENCGVAIFLLGHDSCVHGEQRGPDTLGQVLGPQGVPNPPLNHNFKRLAGCKLGVPGAYASCKWCVQHRQRGNQAAWVG